MLPLAAAAIGLTGSSDTSHGTRPTASPLDATWLAASAAPAGSGGRTASAGIRE